MRPAMPVVAILVIFAGCNQKPASSTFDNWQPPTPKPVKLVMVQSDQIAAPAGKKPPVVKMIIVPTPALEQPEIQFILVSIADQRLFAFCDQNQETPLETFVCSTAAGLSFSLSYTGKFPEIHNHLGTFTIDKKDANHVSGEYNCPMPFALHYYQGHYIHATEPQYYSQLGQPASHGCIRLSLEDAKWLFTHTPVGAKVKIEE